MNIVTQSFNECPKIEATDTRNLSLVPFRPDLNPDCSKGAFVVNRSNGVDAICIDTKLKKNLAESIAKMNDEDKKILGFDLISNVNDIEFQLEEMIEKACRNRSNTIAASFADTQITACDWHFVQNATLRSSCAISLLQSIANEATRLMEKRRQLTNTFSFKDFIIIYAPWIVVLIIIVLAIYLIMNYSSNK